MELKGKNIFITGSTRGIGLAMAHKFASLGANIVLNGRREIGEELISEFSDYGVQVIPISGDVSDSTDAKRMRATYMEGGNDGTAEDIIASVKSGIFVDNFANGQVKIGEGGVRCREWPIS